MFDDATIMITGGTGSFGRKFTEMTLRKYKPAKIIIYSRDEVKQWEMDRMFAGDNRLRFFIGDVRDEGRLYRALAGVDYLVHAAAQKIVPIAEYNPFECIKTNVFGAMNVIECALKQNVRAVIALSTDKACNPINLYGATKLCSDKVFIAGNSYAGNQRTKFAVVRYGNVMGSRGSVIPLFRSLAQSGEIPITDERMTRFMVTLEQAVELVWKAFISCLGGEVYVPKVPSMRIVDIAKTIAPEANLKVIGIRPGEKLHEMMICSEDSSTTVDYQNHYRVFPQLDYLRERWEKTAEESIRRAESKLCLADFMYSSDRNDEWMSPAQLSRWLAKNDTDA